MAQLLSVNDQHFILIVKLNVNKKMLIRLQPHNAARARGLLADYPARTRRGGEAWTFDGR